jgi:hypothetical protein
MFFLAASTTFTSGDDSVFFSSSLQEMIERNKHPVTSPLAKIEYMKNNLFKVMSIINQKITR